MVSAVPKCAQRIIERKPVLWLGAGASCQADPPLPTVAALAAALVQQSRMAPGAPGDDPYAVFDRFLTERIGTRADLDVFLEARFRPGGRDPKPGALHAHLAELAASGAFPAVIDTNYDLLLRRAMEAIKAPFTPAVLEQDLALPDVGCRYLSLHGSRDDWKNVVLRPASYAEWTRRYGFLHAQFRVLLLRHPVLFVGTSLSDPRVLDWLDDIGADRRADLKQWVALVSRDAKAKLGTAQHRGRPVMDLLAGHVELVEIPDHAALPAWFAALAEPAKRERLRTEGDVTVRIRAHAKWTIEGAGATTVVDPPDLGDSLVELRAFASTGLPLLADGSINPKAAPIDAAMRALARQVGGTLAALLPEAVQREIATLAGRSAQGGAGLVRLVVDGPGADAVLVLPWETLLVDGRHPVADGAIDLVRDARVEGAEGLPEPPPPLSVVAHLAAPEGEGVAPLNLEEAAYRMARALDGISKRTRFTEMGTLDDMAEAVRDVEPVVFHFAGHGMPGRLVFEDEDGGPADVAVEEVVRKLRGPSGRLPGAVWLSCCFGAGEAGKSSAGTRDRSEWGVAAKDAPVIAAEIHRRGIPQVLGYFGPVPDPLAVEVDRTLFETLATSGRTFDAVRAARRRTQDGIETAKGAVVFPLAWTLLALYHRGRNVPLADHTKDLGADAKAAIERREMKLHGLQVLEHGFIGRRRLLASLRKLRREGEHTIGLFGLGGLGKTATMIRFARTLHGSDPVRIARDIVVVPLAAPNDARPPAGAGLEWIRLRVQGALEGHAAKPVNLDELLGQAAQAPQRGAALATLLLTIAHGRTLYIDNAETVQEQPADHKQTGAVAWIDAEVADFFTTLAARAGAEDVTLLLTTRYRPRGTVGKWREIDPCSTAEVYRMTGWFKTLRRLPSVLRSELAEERLHGHPRSVEWMDGLLAEEEEKRGVEIDPRQAPEDVRKGYLDPALDGLPARAETDLLLRTLVARLGDAERVLLGECLAIRIPVPRDVIRSLGSGDATLIDRGLLTRYGDLGFAVHPLVAEAVCAMPDPPTWTVAGRAKLGVWWLAKVLSGATLAPWEEALTHLLAGELWDEGLGALREICAETRRLGWFQARLDLTERLKPTRWPVRDRPIWLYHLGDVRYDLGRYTEAEAAFREMRDLLRAQGDADSKLVGTALFGLAEVFTRQGKLESAEAAYRESIQIYERAFGTREHAAVVASLTGLAAVLCLQGKLAAAEAAYTLSIQVAERAFGTREHAAVAVSLAGLANVLTHQGKLDAAEAAYRESIRVREEEYGTREHADVAALITGLADVLTRQGRFRAAEAALREAIQIHEKSFGTREHAAVAASLHGLAHLLNSQGNLNAAEAASRESIQIQEKAFGTREHAAVAASLHGLADGLARQGKLDSAEAAFRESIQIYESVFGTREHAALLPTLANLADLLVRRPGRERDAATAAAEAYSTAKSLGLPFEAVQCALPLFRALKKLGDAARVREIVGEVVAMLAQMPDGHPVRAAVEKQLGLTEDDNDPRSQLLRWLTAMCRRALAARANGGTPEPDLAVVLRRLSEADPPIRSLGDFLTAIASGAAIPEVPGGHPDEVRAVLEHVARAVRGGGA